jgi:hypothetical protein
LTDVATIGHALMAAHLGRVGALPEGCLPSEAEGEVGKIALRADGLHLGGWEIAGVTEEDWRFSIGGRRLLKTWLSDRRGRTVAASDVLRLIGVARRTRALQDALEPIARGVMEAAGT